MKILSLFWCLLFSCASFAQGLPTQQAFPPYPEIWGYDVSDFPAINDGRGEIVAYRMPDGDIWFVIDYSFRKDPKKYMLLKFFKGEKILLDEKQKRELHKDIAKRALSKSDQAIHFSDGTSLRIHSGSSPKRCIVPEYLNNYYLLTDKDHDQKKYSILGVRPQIRIWRDEELCEAQGVPLFYQRLYMLNILIDLGDDTFIAYAKDANLILRFDKELDTQFIAVNPTPAYGSGTPVSRNFFVTVYSVIETLEEKARKEKLPLKQTVHDRLLNYLMYKYT